MTKLIIANWKANPTTLEEAQELFRAEIAEAAKYKNVQTIICPPFVYLEELAKQLLQWASLHTLHNKDAHCSLGAQDIFWEKSGPFTGEISAEMLKNLGVTHVLIGHSDRRYPSAGGGETDELINKKIKATLEAGIVPVLLVGEKNRGDDRRQVLEKQLLLDLDGLNPGQISKVLIAYEPVWAISTNPDAEPDTPESTLEAIKIIDNFITKNYKSRRKIGTPTGTSGLPTTNYLYGGSVTEKNVADFLSHPEISGAVIGGASLRKDEFAEVLRIVSKT